MIVGSATLAREAEGAGSIHTLRKLDRLRHGERATLFVYYLVVDRDEAGPVGHQSILEPNLRHLVDERLALVRSA